MYKIHMNGVETKYYMEKNEDGTIKVLSKYTGKLRPLAISQNENGRQYVRLSINGNRVRVYMDMLEAKYAKLAKLDKDVGELITKLAESLDEEVETSETITTKSDVDAIHPESHTTKTDDSFMKRAIQKIKNNLWKFGRKR